MSRVETGRTSWLWRRGVAASALALLLLAVAAASAAAQTLTAAERARVDSAALAVLAATGAPSASVAVVRGGVLAYEQAYGTARLDPAVPATPAMRYAIGSVSKQFTATAILLLAERGRLSLEDKVARWFPYLTRAGDVSVRQLLSMTAGYQDYWPQDYVFPDMRRPTTARSILRRWAEKPLDFDPGTEWQYSNTNYVIAGAIVERVTRMPLMRFLRSRLFRPLGMTSVRDFDAGPLPSADAAPFLRNGLGPLRPAPKEGRGWLAAAGELAMTAHDLALWDLSIINQTVLRPESYRIQQTPVLLAGGESTGYGLGVSVGTQYGKRRISHGGAVSGYTTTNTVFPDDRAAIVVFTDIYPGGGNASGQIAGRIAAILFAPAEAAPAARPTDARTVAADTALDATGALARRVYEGLMRGSIDRALFTPDANDYFSAPALADYAASLGPLGAPTEFAARGSSLRGGLVIRSYRIRAGGVAMSLTMMSRPDGVIEQYIVERAG